MLRRIFVDCHALTGVVFSDGVTVKPVFAYPRFRYAASRAVVESVGRTLPTGAFQIAPVPATRI
jgi:hypothetical protein